VLTSAAVTARAACVAATFNSRPRKTLDWKTPAEAVDLLFYRPRRTVLRRPFESAQYTSEQFQKLMADHGVVCSMSRSGNVVGAISFEAANPRHEHEWAIFEKIKLPPEKVLIPGVIDSCTNYIEHPDLVSQRIVRLARLVGKERVIAGSDCGFATFAAYTPIVPTIAWAKLRSLSEGAATASRELW
jgi:hypothetical protein